MHKPRCKAEMTLLGPIAITWSGIGARADSVVPSSEELTSMTSIRVKSHSPAHKFNGVKIFSATMFAQRQQLGDGVTQWLAERPEFEIVDIVVTQSSDAAFHCVT